MEDVKTKKFQALTEESLEKAGQMSVDDLRQHFMQDTAEDIALKNQAAETSAAYTAFMKSTTA